jgi:hypothetical protein
MLLALAQPSASLDPDWTQWVPLASAAVALLALLVALSNRNTARRALALSQQQEERRAARLTVTSTIQRHSTLRARHAGSA